MKPILAGLLVVALAGCETPQAAQQTKMQLALGGTVGRSIADYVAMRGYPTDSVKVSNTDASFRWVLTGTGPGAVIPVGGMMMVAPPRQLSCTVILKAHTDTPNPDLKDWMVTAWDWNKFC